MRVAVFGDIHGNYEALVSIYNDIRRKNIKEIILLGDVIGLGPQPIKCLEFVMDHPDIKMILGNHEARQMKEYKIDFYLEGNRHHLWVHKQIKKEHLDYIYKLPKFLCEEYEGKKFYFSHFFIQNSNISNMYYPVSVMDDKDKLRELKKDINCDCVFVGHNHKNYEYNDLSIIDVGTSGCVYDNKTSYYIINLNKEIKIEKRIIEYDRDSFIKSFNGFDNEHNIAYRFFGIKVD